MTDFHVIPSKETDVDLVNSKIREAGVILLDGNLVVDDGDLSYVPRSSKLGFEVFHADGYRLRMLTVMMVDEDKLAEDHVEGIRFEYIGRQPARGGDNVPGTDLLLLHALVLAARDSGDSRYIEAVEAVSQQG